MEHGVDADKLERKLSNDSAALNTHPNLFEPFFAMDDNSWILGTPKPSLMDVGLFYQLEWGENISKGVDTRDLAG